MQELRRKKRKDQQTIPEPYTDLETLRATCMALKEAVEVLMGQRGRPNDVAITWQDLLDLQLIKVADIPTDIGSYSIQPRAGR